MIYLTIVFGLYVVCSVAAIVLVVAWAKEEREHLEDRLMAVTRPEALSIHRTQAEPGTVSYVDEAREAELSPTWNSTP